MHLNLVGRWSVFVIVASQFLLMEYPRQTLARCLVGMPRRQLSKRSPETRVVHFADSEPCGQIRALHPSMVRQRTIHVAARAGGTGTGIGFISGQWQCLVSGADSLPAPVAIGVLNPLVLHAHGGGSPAHVLVLVPGGVPLPADLGFASPAPGALLVPVLVLGPLGKAPAPKGGRTPPTTRMSGVGSPSPGYKAPFFFFRHLVHPLTLPGVRNTSPRPHLTLTLLSVLPKPL